MSKLFKTLLLWLCILSLPVQGMAAVTRLSCGAAHDHQAMVMAGQDHAAHEHRAGHADGMDHVDHHQPQQGHQGADKCSACAACCTGLGLVATFPQWPVAVQAHAPLVATFKLLLPSFLPEGLERPPRSVLA